MSKQNTIPRWSKVFSTDDRFIGWVVSYKKGYIAIKQKIQSLNNWGAYNYPINYVKREQLTRLLPTTDNRFILNGDFCF